MGGSCSQSHSAPDPGDDSANAKRWLAVHSSGLREPHREDLGISMELNTFDTAGTFEVTTGDHSEDRMGLLHWLIEQKGTQ